MLIMFYYNKLKCRGDVYLLQIMFSFFSFETFNQIKSCILENIVTKLPNFSRFFYLSTDSSSTALGADSFRLNTNDHHHVIGFIWRTLSRRKLLHHWTRTIGHSLLIHRFITGQKVLVMTHQSSLIFRTNKREKNNSFHSLKDHLQLRNYYMVTQSW